MATYAMLSYQVQDRQPVYRIVGEGLTLADADAGVRNNRRETEVLTAVSERGWRVVARTTRAAREIYGEGQEGLAVEVLLERTR